MNINADSLQGFLDSVRVDMRADTATLLLVDDTGRVLEPAGSAGLGRRWRGATHVPIGSGFAGRVAATRAPFVVNEINEVSVLNPILREFGLKRLLGVPVMAPDSTELLGVLHVGVLDPRDFTADDIARLETAATEVARRLTASTEGNAHLAALALQRSLLPPAPPEVPGLDIAVRYLPADGDLGGDWYDIFTLPDGKVGIVMGDVEGHGLHSAVAMGRLRSTLRAYALEHDDPADVLQRLDRKLCWFEQTITATVVYVVTEPPFEVATICNAGHPSPLLATAVGSRAEVLTHEPGVLLGVAPELPRHSHKIDFPPGTSLALYTDGLIERRHWLAGDMDPDLERLEMVRSSFDATDDAETACTHIVAQGLGDDSVEDDVALVVLRRCD